MEIRLTGEVWALVVNNEGVSLTQSELSLTQTEVGGRILEDKSGPQRKGLTFNSVPGNKSEIGMESTKLSF